VTVPFEQTRGRGLCRARADRGALPGSNLRRSWQGQRGHIATGDPDLGEFAEGLILAALGTLPDHFEE